MVDHWEGCPDISQTPNLHLHERGESDDSDIKPRRVPVQARSRERVERILDAAAHLLTEEGYNSVKTNLIAKRAGISIGSVYQFFPNRYAIINALGEPYQSKIAQVLMMYMGPDAPDDRHWDETLAEVIDILAEMWRDDWAFHSVWLAIRSTTELQESDVLFRKKLIDSLLVNFWKKSSPEKATLNSKLSRASSSKSAISCSTTPCATAKKTRRTHRRRTQIHSAQLRHQSYFDCQQPYRRKGSFDD
ncbi:MAG: TetR/AcrR family transcriptional regulator [Candidatus Hydrogenedentota bacterium]